MENFTGKDKHTVKVGNHPHTNISEPAFVQRESNKCRILEIHLKLKDQQVKKALYIHRLLYQNLMVTTNRKSTIDTHTQKKIQTQQ